MSEKKHNLSKSELAAIDFMIAYMEDNNQTELLGFIGDIFDAVTNVAQKAVNVVTNVAQTVAQGVQNVANTATQSIQNVAQAASGIQSDSPEAKKLLSTLEKLDLPNGVTLDELIKIRNQYSK